MIRSHLMMNRLGEEGAEGAEEEEEEEEDMVEDGSSQKRKTRNYSPKNTAEETAGSGSLPAKMNTLVAVAVAVADGGKDEPDDIH